jgi:histidinol-phosphatase (PHP family)
MQKPGSHKAFPLPPDLHIHTMYSEHATGTMEETVQSAVAKGLSEIGFADHFPYPPGFSVPAPNCVIPDEATFAVYADEVRRLRSAYADRIQIRFGAEIDHLDGRTADQAVMRAKHGLDYVIGSIHILRGVPIDYRAERLQEQLEIFGGVDRLWETYWNDLEDLIRTGACQVVGHMDILRKFAGFLPVKRQTERAEGLLRLIKEKDLTLEVNTGGIDRANDGKPYPSPEIIQLASEVGVDIAFGSDAHDPKDVGRYFHETVLRLGSLGWKESATFEGGKKRRIPFSR